MKLLKALSLLPSHTHARSISHWLIAVLYLIPLFLLFSCKTGNQKFIDEVEKLEATVQKSAEAISVVDTSKIGNYYRISTEHLEYLQENFKDTMDKTTAVLLSDYKASRKSLRMFLETYKDVMTELSYSKSQLGALKIELENSAMDEEKFNAYFSSESKSAGKLDEFVRNLAEWYDSAIKMYESKNPTVEKIIQQMKSGEGEKK